VQSLNWRSDGTVFATTCKDKQVRVQDPRSNKVTHCANSHQGLKDSRVVWLGDPNWVLTTGFDAVNTMDFFAGLLLIEVNYFAGSTERSLHQRHKKL
jgi:coronin-1B/1C/6